jgi:Holliday junction DNA helicase RuvB
LDEFVGQNKVKENLRIAIRAAMQRNEALEHVLLYGPPGLGKTTLAAILAKELNTQFHVTSGPVLAKPADLAGFVTNVSERDIIFIDELHRMNRVVEEYLYPAMEDFSLDIKLDQGPGARSVRITLPHFTLVGATTRAGMITSPMRSRFGLTFHLDYYTPDDLYTIVRRSARILAIEINEDGAREIARCARGTPRIVNRLLRRVRDFAQVKGDGTIKRETVASTLHMLDIDERGFDEMDRRIITAMAEKFGGGPVGIKTIGMVVGEEEETLEEIYEPYLVKEGFIKKTPRGRELTDLAYQHFKLKRVKSGNGQLGLF